jgi:hypothetical protein
MSQINPFRGVVVPSGRPQGVQVQKDRREGQQRRPTHQETQEAEAKERGGTSGEDGEPHVDVKA